MSKCIRILTILGLTAAVLSSAALAGNTGKIVGKITDRSTGEALFGVNILVVGTTRGATTDPDGKYSIIGIPIGSYTVRASAIGYASSEVKNVSIGADETTPLNFQMSTEEVQLSGVTVTADNILVNSNVTSGMQNVSKEAIESIPNVKNVDDVLKLQAGVVKQGNNLYLRGGRANEVQYVVDGIATNNIVSNTQGATTTTSKSNEELSRLYSGIQSGNIGGEGSLSVSANAIQSVSVQTSGFDADYGNAQSGIVNIVTKSGGDKYSASLQYRTDKLVSDNQNEWYTSFTLGGPEPLSKFVLPSLGVELPGDLSFFVSGDINKKDSYARFNANQFYNPIERRVELNGFLGGLMNGLGFTFSDNQRNAFTFNSKLKYDISGQDQVSYGYRASLVSKHDYDNAYKYRADSSALEANYSIQNNLGWTHFFPGGKTFLKFYIAKLETKTGNDVAGITPLGYRYIDGERDIDNDNFYDLGMSTRWYDSETSVWSTRFDYNSQVHELHLIKTGFEFHFESIDETEIDNPTAPLSDSSGNKVPAPYPEKIGSDHGDYPGYGLARNYTLAFPNRGGLFLQDNIEFAGLNLHVGVRYDYFDPGRQIFDPDYIAQWEAATGMKAEWAEREDAADGELGAYKRLSGGSSFLYYFTHGKFSPRLSIGYPITDRIVFYFNYGHFLQIPDRGRLFLNPFDRFQNNVTIGNPDLKTQRTISYEAGFEDQFTNDMAFAIRAFYKDIFDYVTVTPISNIRLPINFDYASSRGFEVTFNQAFSGNFSLNMTYSYMIAKGRSSNDNAQVLNPDQFLLPRETRLDWDQTHTANVFASYRVGPDEEPKLFGLPFINNYGLTVTWSLNSGKPYTPFKPESRNINDQYNINAGSKPYQVNLSLSFYKAFSLTNTVNVLLTLDVENLLNRKNVEAVQTYNGMAIRYGDVNDPVSNVIYPWNEAESRFRNPYIFGSPRQVLLGMKLNWN